MAAAMICGCGPIGALLVLSQLVGANGSVVGVDLNQSSIETAGAVVRSLGLRNVEVLSGDVNADAIEGLVERRFDLAFTRCFLMHQPDPVHTLRRIANMLRPGGWVVVQEPLRSPPPRSSPGCEALSAYWELLHDVIESTGVPHNTIDRVPTSARAAGLEVAAQNGFFFADEAPLAFDLHARTLAAAQPRAVQSGAASKTRIDELIGELRAAAGKAYDWATTRSILTLRCGSLWRMTAATGRSEANRNAAPLVVDHVFSVVEDLDRGQTERRGGGARNVCMRHLKRAHWLNPERSYEVLRSAARCSGCSAEPFRAPTWLSSAPGAIRDHGRP